MGISLFGFSLAILLFIYNAQAQTLPRKATPEQKKSVNLQQAIDSLGKSKKVAGNNQDPIDLDTSAKKLKDVGLDLLLNKNHPIEGIRKIEEAIKIDPRMPSAYNALWLYYAQAKKSPTTALNYLKKGAKHCPKSSLIRADLGNTYSQLNEHEKAIEQFKEAVVLGTENEGSILYNIGNSFIALNQKSNAILYYNKAINVDKKHFNARRNLAITYYQTGNSKNAVEHLKRLIQLDQNGEHGKWAQLALKQIAPQ